MGRNLGPVSIAAKSYTISTRGVTFKGKALATKCIFQFYSQLLDICSRLVLKTAEELVVPSVGHYSTLMTQCDVSH